MIRLALFFAVLVSTATAEPVSIRSGEHETFSRLVLAIGVGTTWTLDRTSTGYRIQLGDEADGFVTSTIFDRIPRERISAAREVSPDTLDLISECECYADAFIWQPGQLVVDVIDGANPEGREAVGVGTNQQPQDNVLALPDLLALEARGSGDMDLPVASPDLETPAPVRNELAETEAALLEGIARAASQGFLQAAVTPVETTDPPDDTVAQRPEELEEQRLPPPGRPGIGISTAMDRDLALLSEELGKTLGQACLPSELFQIEAWGNSNSLHTQIAALAEDLAGEFGEEPVEAQDALARLYLYFGFGAEARAVLSADKAQSNSRQVLSELANIMDGYEGTYPLIEAQSGCPTPGAFWAFLVAPQAPDDESRNLIIQQLFALPQPLRGQVSSRLAKSFIEVGDADAAERVLRASENGDTSATHDVQAARSLIAEEFDDPVGALSVLSKEASDNVRTTPESLVRLIELALDQGLLPSESDLLLAAAMRQEYRDRPVVILLENAEARGRAANGQYDAALDLLGQREDADANAIVDDIYIQIAADAGAPAFLEFAYADFPNNVSPLAVNLTARRLLDLGFPERAAFLLRGPAQRQEAAERRFLRAEAALDMGEFVVALDALLGMSDDRSRTLRAAAYSGLGEHRNALAALNPDQSSADSTMQFRARAWGRLSVESDDTLASFARVVQDDGQDDPAETLAQRRSILDQSVESRRAIEALLLRFDGSTPTN